MAGRAQELDRAGLRARKAGRVRRHQEGAEPLAPAALALDRHHDEEAGRGAVGDPGLLAVEPPAAARQPLRPRLQIFRMRAGPGLRDRRRQRGFARGEAGQPCPLLRLVAEAGEREQAERAMHLPGEHGAEAAAVAHHVPAILRKPFEVPAAAAIFPGNGEAEQAGFREAPPEVGRIVPAGAQVAAAADQAGGRRRDIVHRRWIG